MLPLLDTYFGAFVSIGAHKRALQCVHVTFIAITIIVETREMRMRKKQANAVGGTLLVLLSMMTAAFNALNNALGQMGWLYVIIGIIALIGLLLWANERSNAQRRQALLEKYTDPAIVEAIMQRNYWVGQTNEQLNDALGPPADIDERVLKTKVKHTWKYHKRGRNRYALRVILDNGIVVGWQTSH